MILSYANISLTLTGPDRGRIERTLLGVLLVHFAGACCREKFPARVARDIPNR